MKLYLSRRERRAQDDRNYLRHFEYLRDELEAHHGRHRARIKRWPPQLPKDVEGYPIGGKTR